MKFDVQGLSPSDATRLLTQFGPNILPERPAPAWYWVLLSQFTSPLVYILVAAAFITGIMGDYGDTLVISLALGINTILGFIQERKANQSLHALKQLVTNEAEVIRNGQRFFVPTSHVVPGDICILSQGNKVPADGEILWTNRLYINEALLTGESMPVHKKTDDPVFMGSLIESGQGLMRVTLTGSATEVGKIALQVQTEKGETPLHIQLSKFSQKLVMFVLFFTAITFGVGLLRKVPLDQLFSTTVALAVSGIPEGLLVSLTVVLAIGMQRILSRKGLIRNLASAETLGGVTVICTDKTGTLTEGKMEVVDAVGNVSEMAKQVLVANDLDDPLVIAAHQWGKANFQDSVDHFSRVDSIPFSPVHRYFASLHQANLEMTVFVNGAPDYILEWTTLSESKKQELRNEIDRLTREGKRLLGLARKKAVENKKELVHEEVTRDLEWVGLLAFSDPVRSGVKDALEHARSAGIRIVVITGDYPQTARFILQSLGMPVEETEIMTGKELSSLSTHELARRLPHIALFARTSPDQKQKIVDAFKLSGEIVAMTGDGVNDAPALHAADIGIAVGNASDSAKESADLVLLDSNFATIVAAIEEGRGIFENIRKIALYLMCDAFREITVVIGGLILGLPLTLTTAQILWINLVSDGFPNLALTVDPKRRGLMTDPPRFTGEPLINTWMISIIVWVSVFSGLSALGMFMLAYSSTGNVEVARSATFLALGINSLLYVFSLRLLRSPVSLGEFFANKWLLVAVIAGLGMQVVPFIFEPLRLTFGLTLLPLYYWFYSVLLMVAMFFLLEFFKFLTHRISIATPTKFDKVRR